MSAASTNSTAPAATQPPTSTQLGPSAAAAPPLGDLLGSLMGALNGPQAGGGQGGGGLDGLMQMAAQVASSPAMQNVAQQLAGGNAGGRGGGAPPNIGALMQSMMPLMQDMLGGGGGASRGNHVVDMAQVEQQLAAILGVQAAREWIQRMEADVEAMASVDAAPLSDAYRGSG